MTDKQKAENAPNGKVKVTVYKGDKAGYIYERDDEPGRQFIFPKHYAKGFFETVREIIEGEAEA